MKMIQVDGKSSSTVSPRTVQRVTLETSQKKNTAGFRKGTYVRRSETLVVQPECDILMENKPLIEVDTAGELKKEVRTTVERRTVLPETAAKVSRFGRRGDDSDKQ